MTLDIALALGCTNEALIFTAFTVEVDGSLCKTWGPSPNISRRGCRSILWSKGSAVSSKTAATLNAFKRDSV